MYSFLASAKLKDWYNGEYFYSLRFDLKLSAATKSLSMCTKELSFKQSSAQKSNDFFKSDFILQ